MNQPNIIFLIQDQMQKQVLDNDSPCILPNLHALIDDSVEVERAYSCNAICSPSRASLLTGTLPHVHGMVDCTHTVPTYRAEYDYSLDTLTNALSDSGYDVSYYGKWHIERSHELERFGISTYQTERQIPSFKVTMEESVKLSNPGYATKLVCGIFGDDATHTEEYYIYNQAISQIERSRKGDKPFCTFISTYAPHDPYVVPREIYELYSKSDIILADSFDDPMTDKPAIYRRMRSALNPLSKEDFIKARRCYYSYCTLVDQQIGRLVQYLKENGLYNNTLIICMADHGDLQSAHGLMMKSVEPFEEVYHIPMVFKLPGNKMAGQKRDFYMSTTEIASTVLEIAGARPLKGKNIGDSMVPRLLGHITDKHYAFAEFFGQRYSYTQRIIWRDNMKYVFNAFDEDELYDLEKDPHELKNVQAFPEYSGIKCSLCEEMWNILKNTNDTSLIDAEYYLMQFAPIGPGEKKSAGNYSLYNKSF